MAPEMIARMDERNEPVAPATAYLLELEGADIAARARVTEDETS